MDVGAIQQSASEPWHPSLQQLVDGASEGEIQDHLAGCVSCRVELRQYQMTGMTVDKAADLSGPRETMEAMVRRPSTLVLEDSFEDGPSGPPGPTGGEEHPDVAASYDNMGKAYHGQGSYDRALTFYEKSLAIRLKVVGECHPDVATSYIHIGEVYEQQGAYEKALHYFEKSLEISLKGVGDTHPNVATNYLRIGEVYYSQGAYKRALHYFEKSLEIRLKVYGKEHPDVAYSYNNIGEV